MNGEIPKDEIFGGYIGEGEKVIRRKNGRGGRIFVGFFCAFSLVTYALSAVVLSQEIFSESSLLSAISPMLTEIKGEIPAGEITVTVMEQPTDEVIEEKEEKEDMTPSGYPILRENLASEDVLMLSNQTSYNPDMTELAAWEVSAVPEDSVGEPLVLVIHTHGTEAYTPAGETVYTDDTEFRSEDISENVVAVGERICRSLEAAGISAIHCEEMFDRESYVDSYARCADAIREYLDEYPSIEYVLDVHRDAIFRQDMSLVAPCTEDGAAQVMLVCGTDEMGADFSDWEENLSFAVALQSAAKEKYSDFMRNINLRSASFNQQLAERFLLVEVGSAGNTLDEALLAGERFGEIFAGVIGG